MFPLVIIPVAAAVAGSATGAKGGTDLWASRRRVKASQAALLDAQERLLTAYEPVQARAERYAEQQAHTHRTVVEPFIAWLDEYGAAFPESGFGQVGGSVPHAQVAAAPERLVQLREVAASSIAAGSAAAGVPSAAMGFAAVFGTASTGASISGLSGVAATNASLAWLGGGSVAAGGGGMAAGQLLIIGTTGAIGVLAVGLGLLAIGERAKTKADKFCAQVDEAARILQAQTRFAPRVVVRIDEVSRVLTKVSDMAAAAQRELFALPADDVQAHPDLVTRATLMTLATARILATPMVAVDGVQFHADLGTAVANAEQACDAGEL